MKGYEQKADRAALGIAFGAREIAAWPEWWSSLPLWRKLLPGSFVACYWLSLQALGGFRPDHLNVGILILALSYGGRLASTLLTFLLPLLMTGVIYDSMRFYSDYLRGAVHVAEPYHFDKRFFGIPTEGGILTPNEFFQLHTHWLVDLLTGFAYLVFIGVFVLSSAYFYFWLSRQGTARHSAGWIRDRSPALMWSFFWVNMIGYSTYYWYAAAPPWYVARYGLGPADMTAQASSAGCARFDQLLGTHFFSEFYGRSADVFGAIPSLHVAYPFLTVLFAYRFGALRGFAVSFYALMCFSAVYLNHHYVLDVIWGTAYAVLTFWAVNGWLERKLARK